MMDAPIGYRGISDLLAALQDAVADKDARIDTLEALLAERPAAPAPSLLALAKLAARLMDRGHSRGYAIGSLMRADAVAVGVFDTDGHYRPGIADAIVALLEPDQHEGVTDGD